MDEESVTNLAEAIGLYLTGEAVQSDVQPETSDVTSALPTNNPSALETPEPE